MTEDLRIVITSKDTSDDDLNQISREVTALIDENAPGARVVPVSTPAPEKSKGLDLALLGVFSLHLLQSGVLKEVIACLSTYITQRRRKVSFTLENSAGKQVTIDAENIGRGELKELIARADELVPKKT